jgi:hypothetical protein
MKPKDHLTVASPDEAKVNLRKKGDSGTWQRVPVAARAGSVIACNRRQCSPEMEQAHNDLKRGLVDTDARASDGRPLGSRRTT